MKAFKIIMDYLLDPESSSLDWLWGLYLIYIPLGLLLPEHSWIGMLFLSHTIIVGTISTVQFIDGFKAFVLWMEKRVEDKLNNATSS